MAEKQDRILIDLIEGGCAKCPHEYGNCERCYYRRVAIETIDYVLQDFGIRKNNLEIAEATLNALLEE